jgi:NADH-quinone oxidoreductase subunit M
MLASETCWLKTFRFSSLNLDVTLGIDGISIFFILLSCFLVMLVAAYSIYSGNEKYSCNFGFLVIFLLAALVLAFSCFDVLFFYIFFESTLIPMYFLIGIFGSRNRKIRAVYLFFFFTLVGSLLMLLSLLYIYSKTGSFDYIYLLAFPFTFNEQFWLWLGFFFSFSSKIPLFPFHIWLPEAHVEAPTIGSILLAGILLKLGVYGFLRFSLTIFPDACIFFSSFVQTLSVLGIIFASFAAIRQTDIKRIIAYSSVSHMNLVTAALFSFNSISIEGVVFQSISHGFVAGGLFLLIGFLYDRYSSRDLDHYSGLVHSMPLFSVFFLILTLSNIALPGTSSFIGEFLLLLGIFSINFVTCFFCTLGVILCGAYSLWVYNRTVFTNLKNNHLLLFSDLNLYEILLIFPIVFFVILIGVFPSLLLEPMRIECAALPFILNS